ncbi:TPA: hypothetical protein DD449_03990 [Candidatus Berkelbacteria bacterium]|nr:hypothetical protein [Candidatus Berkelbacteria bacterium]
MENTNSSPVTNLDESLLAKKKEIEEMKNDSLQLRKTARALLPVVQEYNKLNQEANTLDKERRNKEKVHNTVITYLQQIDTHYLDGFFPLFKEKHPAADPSQVETEGELK